MKVSSHPKSLTQLAMYAWLYVYMHGSESGKIPIVLLCLINNITDWDNWHGWQIFIAKLTTAKC